MPIAIIGQVHVFQAYFLDATNTPVAVTSPSIEVLRYDDNGSKVVLVTAGTTMTAVPGDTGRYTYTYTVPGTLTRGGTIYAVMQGTDGADTLVVETELDLLSEADAGPGLTARFVQ